MRAKLVMLAAMLLIAWGLKQHYADARPEDLSWMLTPTTYLVAAVTGVGFEWRTGEGYFSHEQMFLVEKSCAGINFMIAAFGMLVLALFHRGAGVWPALRVVGSALAVSYASAVVINTVRITVALWLADHRATTSLLSPAEVHRVEGIAVYFGGLVFLHELVRRYEPRLFALERTS